MILKRGYTDTAILISPNLRWARDDFEDLERFRPEVFLGYTVRAHIPILERTVRGVHVSKVVVTGDGSFTDHYRLQRFLDHGVIPSLISAFKPVVQFWQVHRVRGIWMTGEYYPFGVDVLIPDDVPSTP